MNGFVVLWARAFALTLAVELPIGAALLRPLGSLPRRTSLVFLANLASHPAVWFVFPELGLSPRAWLVLAELWAVAIEAFAYASQGRGAIDVRRALLTAIVANAASLALGLALHAI